MPLTAPKVDRATNTKREREMFVRLKTLNLVTFVVLTRYGPGEHAKGTIRIGDSHGRGAHNLIGRQNGVEGHICHDIDDGHKGTTDGDGTWQILDRILQLLNDEVQVIPVSSNKSN